MAWRHLTHPSSSPSPSPSKWKKEKEIPNSTQLLHQICSLPTQICPNPNQTPQLESTEAWRRRPVAAEDEDEPGDAAAAVGVAARPRPRLPPQVPFCPLLPAPSLLSGLVRALSV